MITFRPQFIFGFLPSPICMVSAYIFWKFIWRKGDNLCSVHLQKCLHTWDAIIVYC